MLDIFPKPYREKFEWKLEGINGRDVKEEELLHPLRHIITKFKDDGGKDGEIRSQREIETALSNGFVK